MSSSVPTGRLWRLARLARLGARTGASLALSPDGKAAAEAAARVLGEMRGLAAKVGQMASYVDGFVPEAHREAYATALKSLQARALRRRPPLSAPGSRRSSAPASTSCSRPSTTSRSRARRSARSTARPCTTDARWR